MVKEDAFNFRKGRRNLSSTGTSGKIRAQNLIHSNEQLPLCERASERAVCPADTYEMKAPPPAKRKEKNCAGRTAKCQWPASLLSLRSRASSNSLASRMPPKKWISRRNIQNHAR
jgi:hypothetical protein